MEKQMTHTFPAFYFSLTQNVNINYLLFANFVTAILTQVTSFSDTNVTVITGFMHFYEY